MVRVRTQYGQSTNTIWLAYDEYKIIFLFSRNGLYSRYSLQDWDVSNRGNFNLSERERSMAERLRSDAWQVVKATDARTRNRQASNTKRLGKIENFCV